MVTRIDPSTSKADLLEQTRGFATDVLNQGDVLQIRNLQYPERLST
jgi:hypothetical protein